MKRKILKIVILILSIILLLLCGTAFALMYRQTQPLNNQLEAAFVACDVEEDFNGETKTSIAIKNTGNIDAYLRVRLVSYWVDADGNIVAKPSAMPEINMAAGWIKGANNTYYHTKPVSPAAYTGSLLSSPINLEKDENGYLQVIEVFAEAIQSEPRNAVTGSWGVTVDSNGNIVSQ